MITMANSAKLRKKRVINALLHETFELVLPDRRHLSEKVQKDPAEKEAICIEDESFRLTSCYTPSVKFKMNYGKGLLEVTDPTLWYF